MLSAACHTDVTCDRLTVVAGDADFKPIVSAEPGVTSIELDGSEDYVVLACDGLWDVFTSDEIVRESYNYLQLSTGSKANLAAHLTERAREKGSTDNITVVVVFLRDVIAPPAPADAPQVPLVAEEDDKISGSQMSDASSSGGGDAAQSSSDATDAPTAGGSGDSTQLMLRLQERGMRFLPSLPRPLHYRAPLALKFHPKTTSPLKQVCRASPTKVRRPRTDVTVAATAAAVTRDSVVSVSLQVRDVISRPPGDATRSVGEEQMLLDQCLSTAVQLVSQTAEACRANRRQHRTSVRERRVVQETATSDVNTDTHEGQGDVIDRNPVPSFSRPSSARPITPAAPASSALKNHTWPLTERKRDARLRLRDQCDGVTFAVAGFAHFAGDASSDVAGTDPFFTSAPVAGARQSLAMTLPWKKRVTTAHLRVNYRPLAHRKPQPVTSRACAPAARSTWTLAHEIRAYSLC